MRLNAGSGEEGEGEETLTGRVRSSRSPRGGGGYSSLSSSLGRYFRFRLSRAVVIQSSWPLPDSAHALLLLLLLLLLLMLLMLLLLPG